VVFYFHPDTSYLLKLYIEEKDKTSEQFLPTMDKRYEQGMVIGF